MNKNNLSKLPGKIIVKVANYLPQRESANVLQEVSDMRLEYYEALSNRNETRARGIVIVYYVGLMYSISVFLMRRFIQFMYPDYDSLLNSDDTKEKRPGRPKTDEPKKVKISKPPFAFLIEFADWLPKKHREVLMDEVGEMRRDYLEALDQGKILKARGRIILYFLGLIYSGMRWIAVELKDVIKLIPKM